MVSRAPAPAKTLAFKFLLKRFLATGTLREAEPIVAGIELIPSAKRLVKSSRDMNYGSQAILCSPEDKPATAFSESHLNELTAAVERGSQERLVQFSESNEPWQAVPRWADFLISFGFNWGDTELNTRRISLISMPCESAAAGLVALGAMRRRFAVNGANDSISHYQRIEQLVAKHGEEIFLRHNNYKGRFLVETKDQKGVIWVRSEAADNTRLSNRNKLTRTIILSANACDWRFDGEAPVQAAQGAELPHRVLYENLVATSATIGSNFSHSDYCICLAGRVAGESVSKNVFAGIRFRNHDDVADLSQLLTIHDWVPRTISRMSFFNTRTAQLDRNTGLTRLVVADGDAAFLRVIDAPEFQSSDVVGVIHRAVERERLEAVGVKISELAQWYAPDNHNYIPPAPAGITTSTLTRR